MECCEGETAPDGSAWEDYYFLAGGDHNFIHTTHPPGNDVLTREFLLKHHKFMIDLSSQYYSAVTLNTVVTDKTSGEKKARAYTMRDFCDKIEAPEGMEDYNAIIPCTRMSILDCFYEGENGQRRTSTHISRRFAPPLLSSLIANPLMQPPSRLASLVAGSFDFTDQTAITIMYLILNDPETGDPDLSKLLNETYGITGYEDLPSLHDLTDMEIKETVTNGCKGWVRNLDAMSWPNPGLVGGTSYDENNIYDHGSAILTSVLLSNTKTLSKRLNIDYEEAQRVLQEYKNLLTEFMYSREEYSEDRGGDDTSIWYIKDDALATLLEDISETNVYSVLIGLGIMAFYTILTMVGDVPWLEWCSLIGLLIVFLTQFVTYCVMGLLKISTNVTTNSVLPFLALGLGVDDMFLILRAFQGEVIKNRVKRRTNKTPYLALAIEEAGRSMSMTSISNFFAFVFASTIPVLAVSSFCQACVIVIVLNYFYLIFMFAPMLGWFERYWMKEKKSKRAVRRASQILATQEEMIKLAGGKEGLSAEGLAAIKTMAQTTAMEDPSPRGSPRAGSGGKPSPRAQNRRGSALGSPRSTFDEGTLRHRVTQALFGVGENIAALLQKKSGKVIAIATKIFILFLAVIGSTKLEYGLSISDVAESGTPEYKFAEMYQNYFSFYTATLNTGNFYADFGGRQQELMDLVDEIGASKYTYLVQGWYLPTMLEFIKNNSTKNCPYHLTDDGLLREEDYLDAIDWWSKEDLLGTVVVQPPYMSKEWDQFEEGKKRQVMGQIGLYMSELHGPADFNEMFEYFEKVFEKSGTTLNTDDPTYDKLSLIGTGVPFTYFEQYMIIDEYGLRLGGYAIAAVFVIVSMFSRNLTVGISTSIVVATTMFELVGLLGLGGIKMSALPVVTMLSCIGIIVEFVGHIANR